jgi:hypothetical protein
MYLTEKEKIIKRVAAATKPLKKLAKLNLYMLANK